MAEERCCLWGEWVVSLVGGLTEVSSPSTNRSVHICCLDLLVPSWASVPHGLPTHLPSQTTAFPSAAQVLLCPSRTPRLQTSAHLFLSSEIHPHLMDHHPCADSGLYQQPSLTPSLFRLPSSQLQDKPLPRPRPRTTPLPMAIGHHCHLSEQKN